MITFKPFREWYSKQMDGSRKKRKGDLERECHISQGTALRIWQDKMPVKTDIIDKICSVYGLQVHQVIEYKEDTDD